MSSIWCAITTVSCGVSAKAWRNAVVQISGVAAAVPSSVRRAIMGQHPSWKRDHSGAGWGGGRVRAWVLSGGLRCGVGVKVVLVLVVLLLAGAAAVAVAVTVAWAKLPGIVADRAGKAFGRTVTIGGLHVSPGRWVGVELSDASLANLPGGSRPQMATVGRMTGEVALWPLLHGTVVARSVTVEKADLLLEKVAGQPNWRNGPARPQAPDGGRSAFPTILGLKFQGAVTFRTTSGTPLVTKLDGVTLQAAARDQPVTLTGPGSYQGVPVNLDLKLGSYDQFHDASKPFPTDVLLKSGGTEVHFVGTMTRPLDVDGADGHMTLVVPTPEALETMVGAESSPAPALRLEGAFQHKDPVWSMEGAKGALGEAALDTGMLRYKEGGTEPKTPDKVAVDLRFQQVDVDRLLAQFKGGSGGKNGGGGEDSFVPEEQPNPEITAKLEAAAMVYEKIRFTQPKLSVLVAPGLLKLEGASFGALGGQVQMVGQVKADGKNGALTTTVTGTGLEVSGLRTVLGMEHLPLAGRIDVHATAEGVGATSGAAMRGGRASVVLIMSGGSVSQQVVQLASTNVAGLFTSSKAMVPLSCPAGGDGGAGRRGDGGPGAAALGRGHGRGAGPGQPAGKHAGHGGGERGEDDGRLGAGRGRCG